MTQRQIPHPQGLPPCRHGHQARHILDHRRQEAGGGHLVECRCRATAKHPTFDLAMAEWRRINRIRTPRQPREPGNVVQLGLRLGGGAAR